MEFVTIKKYLGEGWLGKQILFIEEGKWIEDERKKTKEIKNIGYFFFRKD